MRIAPILLSLLLAAPVFAAEPAITDPAPPAAEAERDARASAEREPESADRHCLKETGTRIRPRSGPRCSAYAGRVYTRDDLDRTGQVDIVSALRMLDPSVR